MTIRQLIEDAYQLALDKGFANKGRSQREALMLIISELGEAQESHRKEKFTEARILEDIGQTKYSEENFKGIFEEHIKDTFEDELADTVIRICNYIKEFEIEEKYNTFAGQSIVVHSKIGKESYRTTVVEADISEIVSKLKQSGKIKDDVPVSDLLFNISYDIARSIEDYDGITVLNNSGARICNAIANIFNLAAFMNIDLDKHIELKMKYNHTRPYMHGKKY